eukprot:scaffold11155_cov141-Isochrysis_galbana.AAC.8
MDGSARRCQVQQARRQPKTLPELTFRKGAAQIPRAQGGRRPLRDPLRLFRLLGLRQKSADEKEHCEAQGGGGGRLALWGDALTGRRGLSLAT